jgi:predicted RNA-binding Zn ribbon-like protein
VIAEAAPDKRAPEPLRVVQQFLNSADIEEDEEELDSPAALAAWLRQRDLLPDRRKVTAADLARALDVREGLRAVLFAKAGGPPDPDATERLELAASHAALRPTFRGGDAPELTPSCDGVSGALARLLAIAAASATDGTWDRLKVCADEGCRWAFYDRSKNRSGRWCSMASCGNQEKARSYRTRAKFQMNQKGRS